MSNRRVRRFASAEGNKVVILGPPGRIYTKAVGIDYPIRLFRIPNGDVERYCSEFPNAPKARKACKEFLAMGRAAMGITKGAKVFLKGVE